MARAKLLLPLPDKLRLNHEWTRTNVKRRIILRAQRALECGGLMPLFRSANQQLNTAEVVETKPAEEKKARRKKAEPKPTEPERAEPKGEEPAATEQEPVEAPVPAEEPKPKKRRWFGRKSTEE